MSLSHLKGKRTRFRNILEKELRAGRTLLAVEIGSLDLYDLIDEIDNLIKTLTAQSEKLDAACAELSIEAKNSDRDQEYEQFIEEDNSVMTAVFDCISELERRRKEVKDLIIAQGKSTEPPLEEQMVQMRTQLEQLMIEKQPRQEGLGAQSQRHSSVNLPKLEIPSFNGDKLRWSEFWDTFEATVDQNSTLSNIEKLTYLNSKLVGDAKQAVSGILLSNDNYSVAKTLLKERFGDAQSVVNSHYTQLINMKTAVNSTKGLRSLYDQFERHFRSLEAMGQDTNQDVFVSIMTSKIPKDVLLQLQIQKGAKVKWTVSRLRELLGDYISAREQTDQQCNTESSDNSPSTSRMLRSSTEALVVGPRTSPRQGSDKSCRFCNGSHWSDECGRYVTAEERKQRIRGSCFICLKQGHKTGECGLKKSCYYCKQWNNHHRSLCPRRFGATNREGVHLIEELPTEENLSVNENALLSSGEMVLMQTATADISNPVSGQIQSVRMLFDTGSQRTYITESLAKKLNLKRGEESEIQLVTFGSENPKTQQTRETNIGIMLKGGSVMNISASVVPSITGSILRRPVQCKSLSNWEHLWNEDNLADSFPTEKETTTIELLIGNDYYLDLILPQRVEVQPGLYMLASRLGWILTGRTTESAEDTPQQSMLIMTYSSNTQKETSLLTPDRSLPVKPNLDDFWKLESIGITDSPQDSDKDKALRIFNETLKFENDRYSVTWPWREDKASLPENRELAFGRLKSLVHKMRNNPQLIDKYDDIIQNQLKLGVIEKVGVNRKDTAKHYIPHHPVVNPNKTSTQVRVVYDASARTNKGQKSLNECLYAGPTMLKDLTGILLRFRLNRIAVIADIEKAFLQIGLQEEAKDVTRFFWLKNKQQLTVENNVQVYRFNRVPFGIISSPFLLAATLDFHLKCYRNSVAETIRENIYVDNVIAGTNTIKETIDFYVEAKEIFNKASMNLRDWMSNNESVMQEIPDDDRAKQGPMKILGLKWDVTNDAIGLNKQSLEVNNLTKRTVLKNIASIFDPLGLFSPVTLQGKIFLQALWNKKLQWDESLSEEDQIHWLKIDTNLKEIFDCSMPRYIGLNSSGKTKTSFQLLVFCDASKFAYAAAVYLRQKAGDSCISRLVFSKTRLAPNKTISIPRLELLAALIGVRCIRFVQRELHLQVEQKHIWLDSQCVLNWIGSKRIFSTFIENRLNEIRLDSEIIYHYIASSENPADCATRGLDTKDLKDNQLWWYGPKWLALASDDWPIWKLNNMDSEIQIEEEYKTKPSRPMYEAKLVAGEGCRNK
ncbi:MAG: DUF1759 domain-containing protein, partial [Candidatus Thiodiazotropha sp.]